MDAKADTRSAPSKAPMLPRVRPPGAAPPAPAQSQVKGQVRIPRSTAGKLARNENASAAQPTTPATRPQGTVDPAAALAAREGSNRKASARPMHPTVKHADAVTPEAREAVPNRRGHRLPGER